MTFSKSEMQEELLRFLVLFQRETADLLGWQITGSADNSTIKESLLWNAVNEMYDYGVSGIPNGPLGPGSIIDGAHARTEMFFRSVDTLPMKIYLDAGDNAPPRLAICAVESAVARIVLDGGDRHTDYGTDVHGLGKGDGGYLTLAEVAILADMDERSVRNAANPKLADPLKTTPIGKRSLVSVEEANRWLAGRKGFVPTRHNETFVKHRPPEWDIEMPEDVLELIKQKAKDCGIPFSIFLKQAILDAGERAMNEGKQK